MSYEHSKEEMRGKNKDKEKRHRDRGWFKSGLFWCVLCLFCIYFFALSTRVRFTIVTSLVANKDFKRRGSFANCLLLDVVGVVLCVRGVGGSLWSEWTPTTTAFRPGVPLARSLAWQHHFSSLSYRPLTLTHYTSVLYFFSSRLIFSCHIGDPLTLLTKVVISLFFFY